MKKRSKKLTRIVSLASSDEQRSGEQAGKSRQELDKQRERLGELNAFRHNYSNRTGSDSGISSAHLKDYKQFLERLDSAVSAQKQIIQDSERNYETHRKRWMVKRQRRESLERVLDKHMQVEATHQERLEQKKMDDLPTSSPFYTDEE